MEGDIVNKAALSRVEGAFVNDASSRVEERFPPAAVAVGGSRSGTGPDLAGRKEELLWL